VSDRYRLQVKTHFDAAHHIRDYPGKCSRPHGHRWEVEVVIEGSRLDHCNMLIDFSAVKQAMTDIVDELLDHYDINETLSEPNVTAEYLARLLYLELNRKLLDTPAFLKCSGKLSRVTVWESPECCVKYYQLPMKEANHATST